MKDLVNLSLNKAPGSDGTSNRILKEYAPELIPIICDIYNQSLRESLAPDPLKQLIVIHLPVPKVSPPKVSPKFFPSPNFTH